MTTWIRTLICRALRLPQEPHPPFGATGSIRVFRAGQSYYWFCLGRWALGQFSALIGIVISAFFLWRLIDDLKLLRDNPSAPVAVRAIGGERAEWRIPSPKVVQRLSPHAGWMVPVLTLVEFVGLASFLVQLVVTYLAQRLAYELRWYIVTDRSLRIRAGIWNLKETTMSFANLQQVEFSQGPLQRLLGIADLHVQSAGGGEQKQGPHKGESLHAGVFEGVTNATEIRDLILTRLREYRDSGLGHPAEEAELKTTAPHLSAAHRDPTTLMAAQEVLTELRTLRRALTETSVKS